MSRHAETGGMIEEGKGKGMEQDTEKKTQKKKYEPRVEYAGPPGYLTDPGRRDVFARARAEDVVVEGDGGFRVKGWVEEGGMGMGTGTGVTGWEEWDGGVEREGGGGGDGEGVKKRGRGRPKGSRNKKGKAPERGNVASGKGKKEVYEGPKRRMGR